MRLNDLPNEAQRRAADEELRRAARTGDPLSAFERDLVGPDNARLSIPLRDAEDARHAARVLRELANDLERESSRRDPLWRILSGCKFATRNANARLTRKKRPG